MLRAVRWLSGAAGGFVRPDELGIPLTFEGTAQAGTTLGSGVVMAFDGTVPLPRLLLRIAQFFRDVMRQDSERGHRCHELLRRLGGTDNTTPTG